MRFLAVFALLAAAVVTAARAGAASPPSPELPPQPAAHPAGIPADAMLVSPCVATMGEHWANLKDLPTGPIYGVWQGKPVFTEIMVPVSELQKGFSYAGIHALPGYTIDHIDFEYEPNGHPGLPVPHYDLHAYYVTPAVQASICPSGIPDPAMKPTNTSANPRR
ncbi:MAG: hypothetical protein JO146_05820 [Candidatus Eremiobacteraeota bacterium]|nr:hypothetical protein [Candidatus Eremiobacteraeota bacterium]